ncbi:hypothetical protein E2C01_066224 [Portunus trituberculatus]|uniref:Uncharacterized protein n=1 Tax=Portunus trituberculatus TaxID=210409 RepID=A0A5B7HKY1_PORTR|nr:hypothetical protein [Portunus trituberculatus]
MQHESTWQHNQSVTKPEQIQVRTQTSPGRSPKQTRVRVQNKPRPQQGPSTHHSCLTLTHTTHHTPVTQDTHFMCWRFIPGLLVTRI